MIRKGSKPNTPLWTFLKKLTSRRDSGQSSSNHSIKCVTVPDHLPVEEDTQVEDNDTHNFNPVCTSANVFVSDSVSIGEKNIMEQQAYKKIRDKCLIKQ